ncbi:SHOCT domain-containing protein [Streptomyces sp. NPDC002476]|uniref:SHOCT domain-containing protein n=1 Tax=Streptomyces sp. NPDC002476 TaxID=3364648 RepID=UPI00369D3210
MMWYDGGWGGGWLLMAVIMVVFLSLLTAGIVALIHYLGGGRGRSPRTPSGEADWGGRRAEDQLAERFARGEIDEDEYRRRLTVLREQR